MNEHNRHHSLLKKGTLLFLLLLLCASLLLPLSIRTALHASNHVASSCTQQQTKLGQVEIADSSLDEGPENVGVLQLWQAAGCTGVFATGQVSAFLLQFYSPVSLTVSVESHTVHRKEETSATVQGDGTSTPLLKPLSTIILACVSITTPRKKYHACLSGTRQRS